MSIATFVTMIDMGTVFSFGAYFNVIMDTFQTDRSTTATVQSLLMGITLCFGVVSGALISKLGLPLVTLISSVLVTVGFCASFFATSVIFLYVSISVVAGVGISMAYISSVVVVGRIIKTKRKFMCISLLATSFSLSAIPYPYFIDLLNEHYGMHGSLLIQGGLCCNTFAFFVLCWVNKSHMKCYAKENNAIQSNSHRNENNYDTSDTHESTEPSGTKSILENIKGFITLKTICFLLATGMSVGISNGLFSLVLDMTLWKGFSNSQALMSIVIYQGANIIGKLSPISTEQMKGIRSFYYPMVSAAVGCLGTIVLYVASGYVFFEAGIALCGLAVGGILSSSFGMIIESMHLEQVPVASGLYCTVVGVMSAGFGYGLGILRDRAGSYNAVLVIVTTIEGISSLLYAFGYISRFRRMSSENRQRDTQADHQRHQHSSVYIVNVTKL